MMRTQGRWPTRRRLLLSTSNMATKLLAAAVLVLAALAVVHAADPDPVVGAA